MIYTENNRTLIIMIFMICADNIIPNHDNHDNLRSKRIGR